MIKNKWVKGLVLTCALSAGSLATAAPSSNVATCAANLENHIAMSCSRVFKEREVQGLAEPIKWAAGKLSRIVCQGESESVGQHAMFSIYGNPKPCAGMGVSYYEGWVCAFEISHNHHVNVQNIYYSTCVG